MQPPYVRNDGLGALQGFLHPCKGHLLVLVDLRHGLSQLQELMIQRSIHIFHKGVDNASYTLHLRARGAYQEIVHGLRHRDAALW